MTELVYRALIGAHIFDAVRHLIATAHKNGAPTKMDFNGVTVVATKESDPVRLVAEWQREMDRLAKEYRRSPEYAEQQRKRATEIEREIVQTDALIEELPLLDPTDLGALIDWFVRVEGSIGDVAVTSMPRQQVILGAFMEMGFRPGENCWAAFKPGDRENEARWLIGQCLDGIGRVGSPHQMVHMFAQDWYRRFDPKRYKEEQP